MFIARTEHTKDAAHGRFPSTIHASASDVDIVRAVRSRVWLRALRPSVILAVGWVVFVLVSYPGVMTMESFDQLKEGREWLFTDSHPPAMALLWGLVDRIVPGPPGLLGIQTAAFLTGVYLVLRPWTGRAPVPGVFGSGVFRGFVSGLGLLHLAAGAADLKMLSRTLQGEPPPSERPE